MYIWFLTIYHIAIVMLRFCNIPLDFYTYKLKKNSNFVRLDSPSTYEYTLL